MVQPLDIGSIILTAQAAAKNRQALELAKLERQKFENAQIQQGKLNAAIATGDVAKIAQYDPELALKMRAKEAEIRNLGFTGQKTQAETRGKQLEAKQRRDTIAQNRFRTAAPLIEQAIQDPSTYATRRELIEQITGQQLPGLFDIGTLRQIQQAGQAITPDDRPESIRRLDYLAQNPEALAMELRLRKAGATQVNNNVNTSRLTGKNTGDFQADVVETGDSLAVLDDIRMLGPENYLGNTKRALIYGLKKADENRGIGGETAFNLLASQNNMTPRQAKEYLTNATVFDAKTKNFFSVIRKEVTGAGASIPELKDLEASTINTSEGPIAYQAKLEDAIRLGIRKIEQRVQLLRQQGIDTSKELAAINRLRSRLPDGGGAPTQQQPTQPPQGNKREALKMRIRQLIGEGVAPADAAKQARQEIEGG